MSLWSNRISILIRRDTRELAHSCVFTLSPSLSPCTQGGEVMWTQSEKVATYKPRRELTRNQTCLNLNCGLLASRRRKYISVVRATQSGILFGSPQFPHLYFRFHYCWPEISLNWSLSSILFRLKFIFHLVSRGIFLKHLVICQSSLKHFHFYLSLNPLVQFRKAFSYRGVTQREKLWGWKWHPQMGCGGSRKPGALPKKTPYQGPWRSWTFPIS